jgi:hypothetical protein
LGECFLQVGHFDGGLGAVGALGLHADFGLLVGFAGQDAVGDGHAGVELDFHDGAAGVVGNHLEVVGVAADDGAEGDQRVELPLCAMVCRTSGISSAPGTVAMAMSASATPRRFSSATQAESRPSQTGRLKRLMTMPIFRPAPSRLLSYSKTLSKAGHGLKLRRRGDETGDFEAEAGHGGHLARAGEQAHLGDADIAQDLGADAVGARVPLSGGAGIACRSGG